MTNLNDLWYLGHQAAQRSEQVYHQLDERYADYLEPVHRRSVARHRFETLANRIIESGVPYGAHTLVYRPSGELLLVRHDGVDQWVLPGGGIRQEETFRDAAQRELHEEAGIEATFDGLAMLTRVEVRCGDTDCWGVIPIFEAKAATYEPEVADPDDEISAADWFATLPEDTRDREDLQAWRQSHSELSGTAD
ncbi:MAG: NUDIX domain-containing protein [Halobacteriales archaeon]|nr:NUDIX domain-containing protein [Halobacteriales archaeon]